LFAGYLKKLWTDFDEIFRVPVCSYWPGEGVPKETKVFRTIQPRGHIAAE